MISDSDDYTAIVKLFLQAGADTGARDKVRQTLHSMHKITNFDEVL
jgi:hypothetical protein